MEGSIFGYRDLFSLLITFRDRQFNQARLMAGLTRDTTSLHFGTHVESICFVIIILFGSLTKYIPIISSRQGSGLIEY